MPPLDPTRLASPRSPRSYKKGEELFKDYKPHARPLADRIAALDERSKAMRERAVKVLELHLTPAAIDAKRQLMRMRLLCGEEQPWLYHIIRGMFGICVDVFYHYTAVYGDEFIPPPGNATILCPNHGNSLTDAVVCVSQTPRAVRLTAKDTLFKMGFFGWFVRGTGTIPFQRKDEHPEGADNKASVSQLQTQLEDGALVCLFPEGRSRFHWKVDRLQSGVGTIAYNALSRARDAGRDAYSISLLPCGFNYLHREKFRSGLVVEFGPPIILSPDSDVMKLERKEAIQKLSDQVQELMALTAFHAEDWATLRNAHTARNIFAPLGTQMSMVEFVKYTKYWCSALAIEDPDDPTLCKDLSAYQDALTRLGINDKRISRPPDSTLWLVWSLFLRLISLVPQVGLSFFGVLLWTPVFLACKHMENKVMRRKKKPTHRDEVAQYKMMCGWVIMPPIITISTIVLTWWWGAGASSFPGVFAATAVYLWATIRLMEEVFATARSMLSIVRLLFVVRKEEHVHLRKVRDGLFTRVVHRAQLAGDIKPPQAARSRGFMFDFVLKFSPLRRRKKDWNEVLRLGARLPVDDAAIERDRDKIPVEQHPLAEAMERQKTGE